MKVLLDDADLRSTKLLRAVIKSDNAAISAELGELAPLLARVGHDVASWRESDGPLLSLGPAVSRAYPFGKDMVRTFFQVTFARKTRDVQFTWKEGRLYELLSDTGAPSSVILPLAEKSRRVFLAYDLVLKRSVELTSPNPGAIEIAGMRLERAVAKAWRAPPSKQRSPEGQRCQQASTPPWLGQTTTVTGRLLDLFCGEPGSEKRHMVRLVRRRRHCRQPLARRFQRPCRSSRPSILDSDAAAIYGLPDPSITWPFRITRSYCGGGVVPSSVAAVSDNAPEADLTKAGTVSAAAPNCG